MHIPVLDLLPHVHEEHLDLLGRPLERLGEQPRNHAAEPKQQVLHLKGADQLEPLVLGPGVARHLVDDLGHLLEAALLEPALPAQRVVDGRAEDLGALRQRVRELAHRAVRRQRVVVALQDARHAVELDPAAGLEMSARSLAGVVHTYKSTSYRYDWSISRGQSRTATMRSREKIRSNVFSFHAHSCSMSSSSKAQLGGTLRSSASEASAGTRTAHHSGCVGAMSTPRT